VNVRDMIKNLFSENVKVSFIKGAETAQDQIVNGILLEGHIGVKQGYLTYTYFVVDHENDRSTHCDYRCWKWRSFIHSTAW
jgi:hypothetical protein